MKNGPRMNGVTSTLIRQRRVQAGDYWSQMCISPNTQIKLNVCFKKNTAIINLPSGFTSHVHPLDVINNTFTNLIKEQFEKHPDDNLNDYVGGKLTASDWKILTTK